MGQKITELSPAAALDGTELFEVVQNGVNKAATPQQVATLFAAFSTNAGGVNIADPGSHFTGTTVEEALQELGQRPIGGDATLRGELSSGADGKGTDLAANRSHAGIGPAYLQTLSAVRNGEEVPAIKAIPAEHHSAIYSGTSTYNAASDLNELIADMIGGGGQILLPRGKVATSGFVLNYTALNDDSKPNRITIRGQGSKATEIAMLATSGNAIGVTGLWGYPPTLGIEGVRIRGNGGTTRALRAAAVAGLNLRDVICQGAQYGWEFIDVLGLNFINSSTVYNTYGAKLSRASHTYPNAINIFGGSIGGNSVYGLESTGGNALNFYGVQVEGNGVEASGTAPSTSWGLKIIDAGAEGGVAVNLNGCYFEVNNGQADLWVLQTSRSASVRTDACTFNRISSTKHTTNNIRLEASGAGRIHAELGCNGYFTAGDYTRDATRRTVLGTGVSGGINFGYGTSHGAHSADVDKPYLAQAGRANDPECQLQAWGRMDGQSSAVASARRIVSYTRNSVGNYTVVLDHDVPSAKCLDITFEANAPLCWQLFSEAGTTVNFTVRDSSGTLTDPLRIFFKVLG